MLARALLVMLLVVGSTADAAKLCAHPKSDGSFSTAVKIRDVCKPKERRLGLESVTPLEVVDEATITTTTTTIVAGSSTTISSVSSSTTTTAPLTDNGDGTISDPKTHLMWEKLSDDGSIHDKDNRYTFATATSEKIALLNTNAFAGHTDWRLPERLELESILDLTIPVPGPAVVAPFNQGCTFGCTVTMCSCTNPGEWFWSATPYANAPSTAVWVVHFTAGEVGVSNFGSAFYARAVRNQ